MIHLRNALVVLSLGSWFGCESPVALAPPPLDRFYFPGALIHVDTPESQNGMLYVASTNFDRRYASGAILPVMLDTIEGEGRFLPSIEQAQLLTSTVELNSLQIPEQAPVFVRHFPGDMDRYVFPDGSSRIFVPSRGENGPLQVIDVRAGSQSLFCAGQPEEVRDCSLSAPSLIANELKDADLPRAPSPSGVAVGQARGEVYVTHLQTADSPVGSGRNARSYLIRNPVDSMSVPDESYLTVGTAGAHSIVVGSRYAFLTGRFFSPVGPTLRAVDLDKPTQVIAPAIENSFRVLEARGLALSNDERRLYVAGRSPDTLLIIDVEGATTDNLSLRVSRGIALPAGANQVRIIPRAGRGNLVVVTCSTAAVVVFYDDETGDLIGQVSNVGEQPFGVAVDERGNSARLYVSNFEDGRIAVIDIADLTKPRPKLVAHIGERQTCVVKPTDKSCTGVQP